MQETHFFDKYFFLTCKTISQIFSFKEDKNASLFIHFNAYLCRAYLTATLPIFSENRGKLQTHHQKFFLVLNRNLQFLGGKLGLFCILTTKIQDIFLQNLARLKCSGKC